MNANRWPQNFKLPNLLGSEILRIHNQLSSLEDKMTLIETKIKQTQILVSRLPSSSNSDQFPSTLDEDLLIGVLEKESRLMAEAFHTVEQVEKMVEMIRNQNH